MVLPRQKRNQNRKKANILMMGRKKNEVMHQKKKVMMGQKKMKGRAKHQKEMTAVLMTYILNS